MPNDKRLQQLHNWLNGCLNISDYQLHPASGDASFRRYFRLNHNGHSYIIMDAPPDKENSLPFVEISKVLINVGLNVPEVLEQDLDQGFLLLTDLGQQQYLEVLNSENADRMYGDAMDVLLRLQACSDIHYKFPLYNTELLLAEMELFRSWLINKHLDIELTNKEQDMLNKSFKWLCDSAIAQPQVPVHRDYHSRNLMFDEVRNPGILDFQDAVLGPVTYDLVSLLRDCYIEWPREQVESWVTQYHERAVQAGVVREENESQFLRWFDLMGLQRHLKAAGIFARLKYRDDKPGYLADIPRTLGYIIEVSGRYPELKALHNFLSEKVNM